MSIPYMVPSTVVVKARKLKEGQSFTARLRTPKITYADFNKLLIEVAFLMPGIVVERVTGCYTCPRHRNDPQPHYIRVTRL